LRDDNQRLQSELSACRERLAEIDGEHARVLEARRNLEEIRGKHASCVEVHQMMEEKLSAVALLLEHSGAGGQETRSSSSAEEQSGSVVAQLGSAVAEADGVGLEFNAGAVASHTAGTQLPQLKRRRFGIFPY
jgi:hypothetical protein